MKIMWASIEFAFLSSVLSLVEENYILNLNFCIPLMVLSIYLHSEYMQLKIDLKDFNASLYCQKNLVFGNALCTTFDVKHHNSRLYNPSNYY